MFVCLALSLGANEDCGRGARGAIISNGRAKRWPGALAPNAPRSLESGRRRRPLPFLFSLFPCFPGFSHFRRSLFFALFRFHSFFFLPFSFPSFPAFVSFPPFFMTKTDARLRLLASPEATRRRGVCRFKSKAIRPGRAGSAESPPPLAPCPLHSLIPCAAAPGRARRFDFSPSGLNRVELARPGRPVRRQEAHCGLGGKGAAAGAMAGRQHAGRRGEKKRKGGGGAGKRRTPARRRRSRKPKAEAAALRARLGSVFCAADRQICLRPQSGEWLFLPQTQPNAMPAKAGRIQPTPSPYSGIHVLRVSDTASGKPMACL